MNCFIVNLVPEIGGSSQPDSNPAPPAPLGPAPAPPPPRGLPPLSALPLPPAPPGSLCSGSVAGTGDVAAQRGAAWKIHVRSSCEPPSDQPQAACLPPQQERRRCPCWVGLAPAVHAPPPLSMRDLTCGKAKAPRAPSVPHRAEQRAAHLAMHRASASTAANTGAEGALSPPHMLPRQGPLFALVRRSAHQTANGSRRHGCEA